MKYILSKEVLIKMYIEDKKSIRIIAKELKRGEGTIFKYLKIYEIETRPQHIARPQNEETRKKISLAHSGKVLTTEHRKNLSIAGKGNKHNTPKKRIQRGYIHLYKPENSMSNNTGYVYEHRILMSEFLGRPLLKNELVHHINEIKTDNRIQNLQIVTRSEHRAIHNTPEWREKHSKRIKEVRSKKYWRSNKSKI